MDTFAIYKENLKTQNVIDEEGRFVKGMLQDNKQVLLDEFLRVFS